MADINAAAMKRFRRAIVIELSGDDTLHVTLNGVHTVNDETAFANALCTMYTRIEAAYGEKKT